MKKSYAMIHRRRMLQTGAALVAGGSLCLEEMLQAEQARANPVKITAVRTYLLKTELKRAFGVSISVPLDKTRSTLLVKIETDAGIVGGGETAPIMGTREQSWTTWLAGWSARILSVIVTFCGSSGDGYSTMPLRLEHWRWP